MPTISSNKPYRVGRSRTGLGLFATKPIKKGTKIIRYFGPLLDAGGTDYGFTVDLSGSAFPFGAVKSYSVIDPTYASNSYTGPNSSSTVWYTPGQLGQHKIVVQVVDANNVADMLNVFLYAGPRAAPVTPPPVVPPNVPPPSGTPGQAAVRQIGGQTRYETSRLVSQAQWAAGAANAVVLARGDAAPDALAGVPLAARVKGPLLLTDPKALDSLDRAEIDRVLGGAGSGKTVYILGGTAAVSPAIEAQLAGAGYKIQRLQGTTRYGTALAVAQTFGATSRVILATGLNFPDALAAGPLGAVSGEPIVLSQDAVMDPDTAAFVRAHQTVDAVGMQAYRAASAAPAPGQSVSELAGGNRYDTAFRVALAVASRAGHQPAGAAVASGITFPDALTGGAYAANAGLPLLLTDPRALDPSSTGLVLHQWAPTLASVTIFGGPTAVSRTVVAEIAAAVGGHAVS